MPHDWESILSYWTIHHIQYRITGKSLNFVSLIIQGLDKSYIYLIASAERNFHVTHWGGDEIDNISQTAFSNVFQWKCWNFNDYILALVHIMAWRRQGAVKPLSESIMVSLPTHICVTRPQRVTGIAVLTYIYPIHGKAIDRRRAD